MFDSLSYMSQTYEYPYMSRWIPYMCHIYEYPYMDTHILFSGMIVCLTHIWVFWQVYDDQTYDRCPDIWDPYMSIQTYDSHIWVGFTMGCLWMTQSISMNVTHIVTFEWNNHNTQHYIHPLTKPKLNHPNNEINNPSKYFFF